jgi:hypothetical protein
MLNQPGNLSFNEFLILSKKGDSIYEVNVTTYVIIICLSIVSCIRNKTEIKDLKYFLHHLYTLDDLPLLEDSHTYISSTWDIFLAMRIIRIRNNSDHCFLALLI